jgi:gamma-glutamylcyclotransferase (GGCT)/AIG2-like uncharacterized protein YtfP
MKVFVYGTLQRGQRNNWLLKGQRCLGRAVTVEKFTLTDMGFPFMRREPALAPVVGELFDIGDDTACLAGLDRLESEGRMYDRVTGLVECNGERHVASYYVQCASHPVWGGEVPVNAEGLLEWRKQPPR